MGPVGDLASTVESASAAYFGITVAPHEYFDQTVGWAKQSQMLDHNEQDHARDEARRKPEMRRSVIKDNAVPGYQQDRERNHRPCATSR